MTGPMGLGVTTPQITLTFYCQKRPRFVGCGPASSAQSLIQVSTRYFEVKIKKVKWDVDVCVMYRLGF